MQISHRRFTPQHCPVCRSLIFLVLTAIIPVLLAACGTKESESDSSRGAANVAPGPEYTEYTDLSGKTVSMLTGAPFEELVLSKAPDVGEFTFFTGMPDMILALKAKKTDAVLNNNAIASLAVNRDPELELFPQSLKDGVFGIAFDKGSPDRGKWQAAYDTLSEETKQALWDKWTGSDDSAKVLPAQDWPGKNGTVKAAVCDTLEPMSYTGEGGEVKGFDVEMILLMAKELDVHVEFKAMEFAAILSYVQSGKALLGAGSIIVTDERKQAADFVEYYPAAFVLIVRASHPENAAHRQIGGSADLEQARIGLNTGSIQAIQAEERFPGAKFYYFPNSVDMLAALRADKIDAYVDAEASAKYMQANNPDMAVLNEKLAEGMKAGAVFEKSEGGTVIVVLKSRAKSGTAGFLAPVADSFEKTFIRENRWELFLMGIGTTLLITILSIIFGTILGFMVFMLCRNGNPAANTITRFLVWLVEGMPVVVLLMILYYIIFGKVSISGTFVSVIGFTLLFGTQVYTMVKGGVATVDRGQIEAAYSLGYTDRKAFFRIVLPQALPHIMPTYKGQIKALIKATAIVGYVAVQDLTKMGDIVRSRTYEAFFPLIAVAIIYFVLAAILMYFVNKLELCIDPKKRGKSVEGDDNK